MGTSFILPLPQLPLSADPGGSTRAQIGMREVVRGENLLSHKLTAHVQALSLLLSLSVSVLYLSLSISFVPSHFVLTSLPLSIYLLWTLYLRLPPFLPHHIPLRCLLSNVPSVASYPPLT